jgi:hypothetical protein
MTAESESNKAHSPLPERITGLYDELGTPLEAVQNLAQELRARPEQDTDEQKMADAVERAAVHLAEARLALYEATQA